MNINSVRNKLGAFKTFVSNSLDIICIAETKLDKSFPTAKFKLVGYKNPYRSDVSDSSGGLLVYVNSSIPSRQLSSCVLPKDIEIISFELNIRKHKWLVISIYRNPSTQKLPYFLKYLSLVIEFYSKDYESLIIMGDFNDTPTCSSISSFMTSYGLYSMLNTPTCFKSPGGRCIDLILTNKKHSFQKTQSVETGISDHHHLICTMLKQTFDRAPPKVISYRSYRNFSTDSFKSDLVRALAEETLPGSFSSLHYSLATTLQKHAPCKKRVLRGNHKPHVSKIMRKAIMKRSRLKNRYNISRNASDWELYKKQRNFIVNLNRQEKKQFLTKISDKTQEGNSKKFWKYFTPFFSNKCSSEEAVSLVDKGILEHDTEKICNIFNNYFINITSNLNIELWKPDIACSSLVDIIKKYDSHPSILKIKESHCDGSQFQFIHIHPWDTYQVIMSMNKKKSVSGCIPTHILQSVVRECCVPLTDCFNNCLNDGSFPNELKLAEVIPVFKTGGDPCDKTDYRPISILPSLSKVFEKLLADQITAFFQKRFSPLLCGFRKNHSTQLALLRLLQKWQACLDKSGIIGTILMDLSKAFDSMPHELLIAKLEAYGFSVKSLKLVSSYLSGRFQRVRIGSNFSKWLEVLLGVPQGSILGPLFFNVFINDFFLFLSRTDVCNFADDNTLYSCAYTLQSVISDLEYDMSRSLSWFKMNQLVANPAKFQFMFLGTNTKSLILHIGGIKIKSTSYVKLLGVSIDCKLVFDLHITNMCNQASSRVRCLYRVRNYLDVDHARQLCDSFILSVFNYCPIIWMFCNKGLSAKINSVHKRALRAVTGSYDKSFQQLISADNSLTVHRRSLHALLTVIYRCFNEQAADIVVDLFQQKTTPYYLRACSLTVLPPVNSVRYGLNSVVFRGSLLWNSIPDTIKKCTSVGRFQASLSSLKELKCSCQLCQL